MDCRKGRIAPSTCTVESCRRLSPPINPPALHIQPTATLTAAPKGAASGTAELTHLTITLSPSAKKIGPNSAGHPATLLPGANKSSLPPKPSISSEPRCWFLQAAAEPKAGPQSWGALAELQDEPQLISSQAELSPALSFKPEKQINQWENPAFTQAAMVPTVLVLFSEVPAASQAQDEF